MNFSRQFLSLIGFKPPQPIPHVIIPRDESGRYVSKAGMLRDRRHKELAEAVGHLRDDEAAAARARGLVRSKPAVEKQGGRG